MKMIFAIIRPEKLDAVVAALNERDVYLMTVSDVRGCGRQRGHTETYRGTEQQIRLLPKVKLEIAVNDNFVEPAMEAIMLAARAAPRAKLATASSSCCRWRIACEFERANREFRPSGPSSESQWGPMFRAAGRLEIAIGLVPLWRRP